MRIRFSLKKRRMMHLKILDQPANIKSKIDCTPLNKAEDKENKRTT